MTQSDDRATGYAVRFDVPGNPPEGAFYAGRTPDGALGFAPSLASAEVWATEVIAGNFLANGYGPNMSAVGTVVRVIDGVEVTDEAEAS